MQKERIPAEITDFFMNVMGEYSKVFGENEDPKVAKMTQQLSTLTKKLATGVYPKEKEQEMILKVIRYAEYFTSVLPAISLRALGRGTFNPDPDLTKALLDLRNEPELSEEVKKIMNFMFDSVMFPWGMEDILAKHKTFKLVSLEEWTKLASDTKNKELTHPEAKIKVVYEADYEGYLRPDYLQIDRAYNIDRFLNAQKQDDTFNLVNMWCGIITKGTYYVYVPSI